MRGFVKTLVCVAVMGLLVASARAATLVGTPYVCEKDNASHIFGPTTAYGSHSSRRIANNNGDGRVYAEWSDADKTYIYEHFVNTAHANYEDPAGYEAGATHFEVRLAVSGAFGADTPGASFDFEAFKADDDWVEATATYLTYDGATAWQLTDGTPVSNFFGLTETVANTPWSGTWIVAQHLTPATFRQNQVVLDAPVLSMLLTDPDCHGLRGTGNTNLNNRAAYLRGQWGTSVAPALMVYAVPEPATMALLGLGMAALAAIRRRRKK